MIARPFHDEKRKYRKVFYVIQKAYPVDMLPTNSDAWCGDDEDINRIETLASELFVYPVLPPLPDDASKSWTDVLSGVALPMCHCAVRNCGWAASPFAVYVHKSCVRALDW